MAEVVLDTREFKVISLLEWKRGAQRLLPTGSQARAIIMSLPDFLPRSEALPKLEICLQLIHNEVKRLGTGER